MLIDLPNGHMGTTRALHASPTHPHPTSCGRLSVCAPDDCKSKLQQMASEHAQKGRQNLQTWKSKNLSFHSTLGKAKERLAAPSLVLYRTERRHSSLRILPQEGARSMEQVYP